MVSMSYRDPVTKALIELPMGCAGGGSPVGFVGSYAGSVAPVGWVICDGRAHNSPALHTILGSDNTPDLRGRFILAASATHAAKTTGGEETHTLLVGETPIRQHYHERPLAIGVNSLDTYDQGVRGSGPAADGSFRTGGVASGQQYGSASGEGAFSTAAHNNMPPFYAMIYIIKAFAESANGGITQADADARYVNVSGDTMTGELSINVPEDAGHFRLSGAIQKIGTSDQLTVYGPVSGLAKVICADPVAANQAATKNYVDNKIQGGYSNHSGSQMSVVFPVPFSGLPKSIIVTAIAGQTAAICSIRSSSPEGFAYSVVNQNDNYIDTQVFWMAIGDVPV
jgi:microcystin-dependent protein